MPLPGARSGSAVQAGMVRRAEPEWMSNLRPGFLVGAGCGDGAGGGDHDSPVTSIPNASAALLTAAAASVLTPTGQ